jgi:hypothetical protein
MPQLDLFGRPVAPKASPQNSKRGRTIADADGPGKKRTENAPSEAPVAKRARGVRATKTNYEEAQAAEAGSLPGQGAVMVTSEEAPAAKKDDEEAPAAKKGDEEAPAAKKGDEEDPAAKTRDAIPRQSMRWMQRA